MGRREERIHLVLNLLSVEMAEGHPNGDTKQIPKSGAQNGSLNCKI